MRVLGIETSADDTGVALIEAEGGFGLASPELRAKAGPDFTCNVLANAVSSQHIHAGYGGIFPALAKREHAKNIVPLLERVLRESRILASGKTSNVAHVKELLAREPEIFKDLTKFLESYERPEIDCIAVTVGPGLEPCLWTGINLARVLADVWEMRVVPVNHMEGHIVISMMDFGDFVNPNLDLRNPNMYHLAQFEFPALALLVSGGHTELILMKSFGEYQYLWRTRDDAAGEAFDKIARLLELPYPGGPHISRLAEEARRQKLESNLKLPRPMLNEDNYDFSFSGLKTAVLRLVEGKTLTEREKMEIARETEEAIADVLAAKTLRAADEFGAETILLGGGVSANTRIRKKFAFWTKETSRSLLVSPPEFSTDNGLMIAITGYFHALKNEYELPGVLKANGAFKLGKTL